MSHEGGLRGQRHSPLFQQIRQCTVRWGMGIREYPIPQPTRGSEGALLAPLAGSGEGQKLFLLLCKLVRMPLIANCNVC